MKCEKCGKDEAHIKLTRIEGGQVFQIHLCQSCAAEASPYQKKILQKQASIDTLLQELLKHQKVTLAGGAAEGEEAARIEVGPCPSCGLEYASYRSTFMLGCPDCYDTFAEVLEADLRKIHRATRHVGAGPNQDSELVDIQRRLEEMRDELRDAIEYEDFERAAFLRDEITKLEKQPIGKKPPQEKEEKSVNPEGDSESPSAKD